MSKRLRASPAWLCGAVLLGVATAAAENVHVQIECGDPPRTAPTEHRAYVEGLVVEDTVYQSGLAIPLRGRLLRLRIDDRELTLPNGTIQEGFVETAELGRVFLSLQSSDPGYLLIVRPEQIDAFASRPPVEAGLPPEARPAATPLVERGGIRQ